MLSPVLMKEELKTMKYTINNHLVRSKDEYTK